MSFIVQISPFVHLFTLNIVFRWGAGPGALSPPTPRYKLCLHFMLYLATPLTVPSLDIGDIVARLHCLKKFLLSCRIALLQEKGHRSLPRNICHVSFSLNFLIMI